MPTCALCKSQASLKQSHVIPHFVFDRIKKNSPTGFLRGRLLDVDLRQQDGDRHKLLCNGCEQRFSQAEKKFAEEVFMPYHESGTTSFAYGPWLSYFISSVNWRTLHLDNIDFHSKQEWSDETLSVLDTAETILADFLLERRSDVGNMENHISPMFEITHACSPLDEPNFYFRASAFDYTFFVPGIDAYYVCANLAGVLIFTVIRKGRGDIWENTLVHPSGGFIKEARKIDSPLIANMIELLADASKVAVSEVQKDKIIESIEANHDAPFSKAMQIRELDTRVRKARR